MLNVKGWLSTLCSWEAAVHTNIKLMMMMMMILDFLYPHWYGKVCPNIFSMFNMRRFSAKNFRAVEIDSQKQFMNNNIGCIYSRKRFNQFKNIYRTFHDRNNNLWSENLYNITEILNLVWRWTNPFTKNNLAKIFYWRWFIVWSLTEIEAKNS